MHNLVIIRHHPANLFYFSQIQFSTALNCRIGFGESHGIGPIPLIQINLQFHKSRKKFLMLRIIVFIKDPIMVRQLVASEQVLKFLLSVLFLLLASMKFYSIC